MAKKVGTCFLELVAMASITAFALCIIGKGIAYLLRI
jgi:hypothetical protein